MCIEETADPIVAKIRGDGITPRAELASEPMLNTGIFEDGHIAVVSEEISHCRDC